MKFGHFDDKSKEYVIDTPKTPYPWINYLGNESFFSILSNTCGGYSFYKDARLRRITRYQYNNSNLDMNGKYFYIKDNDSVWNPGWKPTKTELDSYKCRHGLGYSIFESSKNKLSAKLLNFVPMGIEAEVMQLTLNNNSDKIKNIDLFSYVEFALWDALDDSTNFQRNFSIGRAEKIDDFIVHFTDYKDRRSHYAFLYVNKDIEGFDCNRETFTGTHNGLDKPDVVYDSKSKNSVAYGWAPIASQHLKVSLNPEESKTVIFILGYAENDVDNKWKGNKVNVELAENLVSALNTPEKVETHLNKLTNFWKEKLAHFKVNTPDEHVNRMVNIWNQYQCMVTYNLSRSASYFESGIGRGMGFRDSNQDLLGYVHYLPERARERLIDLASTQFEDGGAYHQYQPLTKKGNSDIGGNFNDDPIWLIAAVIAYINETGDFSILDEDVPFDNDENNTASMYEHLRRSFNHVVNNKGPHELPLIGRADWNDCLNFNVFVDEPATSFQTAPLKTDGKTAESLMIAGAFMFYGKQFAELANFLKKDADAEDIQNQLTQMENAIKKHGWDGNWFLRAYDAHSEKVGSSENKEGQIFIESQGFCCMAEIGKEEGWTEKALDSVKERLDSEHGIVLCNPAFTTYHKHYGEISTFLEGYKENAGIFCHNNPWIIISEALLGRGDKAFDYYMKINPSYTENVSELHRTEPYVYSQMIAGKDAYKPGEAKNSWLTGTAAWNFVAISQYILGIQASLDGLKIDPSIPSGWSEYSVSRVFRGKTYNITVKNPDHVRNGVKSVSVNGQMVENNIIMGKEKINNIVIILG